MNIKRGLVRLWIFLTLIWFVGVGINLYLQIDTIKFCSEIVSESELSPEEQNELTKLSKEFGEPDDFPTKCIPFNNRTSVSEKIHVEIKKYSWVLVFPFLTLVLGMGFFWVIRGFRNAAN